MKLTENNHLKNIIFERLKEADLKPSDLIKDAEERGVKITASSFSKYKKGVKNGLTEDQLLFICYRLYIPINVSFGVPKINNGKLVWVIPKYDHLQMLKLISNNFPNGKK